MHVREYGQLKACMRLSYVNCRLNACTWMFNKYIDHVFYKFLYGRVDQLTYEHKFTGLFHSNILSCKPHYMMVMLFPHQIKSNLKSKNIENMRRKILKVDTTKIIHNKILNGRNDQIIHDYRNLRIIVKCNNWQVGR